MVVQHGRFHGVMSRETAEEICKASGMREGSHLVRESPNTPGQYVITLVSEGVVSRQFMASISRYDFRCGLMLILLTGLS